MRERAIRLALACLFAASPAAAQSGAELMYSPDDIRFFYEEIYEPFFRKEVGPGGKERWVNQRGRTPHAEFPAVKGPDTVRIFVLGESVAQRFLAMEIDEDGVEDTALAMTRAWASFLPGARVEIIAAAVASYDSARARLVAEDILRHEPDLLIVLSGNNENPDPASEPSFLKRFVARRAAQSDFIRDFREFMGKSGMRVKEYRTPAQLKDAYIENLSAIAGAAAAKSVPTVLCALPRNLADFPPEATLPLREPGFARAWLSLEAGDGVKSEKLFSEYIAAEPNRAFAYYGRGLARRRQGRLAEAREDFLATVELSGKGSRPSFNAALRELARGGTALVTDLETAFSVAASSGLPDSDMFEDAIHWHRGMNPLVNAVIARTVFDKRGAIPGVLAKRAWDEAALSAAEAQARRWSPEDDKQDRARKSLMNGIWTWNPDPRRNDEFSVAAFDNVQRWVPALLPPLLTEQGRNKAKKEFAASAWTRGKVERLEHIWPEVLDNLGEMYRRRGLWPEAEKAFRESLRLDPNRTLTTLRLAQTLRAVGKKSEAQAEFDRIAGQEGRFPEIGFFAREVFTGKGR